MKKYFIILSALLIVLTLESAVFAVCAPGSFWTAAWTDQYGQTTYSLEAPCKVYIGVPFTISATVTDSAYPNDTVAALWSIRDNGAVIGAGDGFGYLATVNGQWQRNIDIVYPNASLEHKFEFGGLDLGQGMGTNYVGWYLTGDTTVDPYPAVVNNPPTVDAGPDIYLTTDEQKATVIQGRAYDADGNPLTYRWLEGETVLQYPRAVDSSGNAPLNLATIPLLSKGTHVFTLEVSDGTALATDNVMISVANSAPTAVAAGAGTYEIGDTILLNGTVSDIDGDSLTYRWLIGQTVLAQGVISSSPGGSPVQLPEQPIVGGLPLGSHAVTLEVSDGIDTVSETIVVNIIDTIAPTLAPTASANMLWPPNGGMTEVTINAHARDNGGGPVLLSVRVSSSEASTMGHGRSKVADFLISRIDQSSGTVVLQLRSARSGKGGDRVYSVSITASDISGNTSKAPDIVIKVPHDKGLHKGQLKTSSDSGAHRR